MQSSCGEIERLQCVDILTEIAQDPEQNGQIRVSACKSLLDMTGRYNEQLDI